MIESAVVGIPHDKWGETPLAVVVTNKPDELKEDDIIDLVVDKLSKIKNQLK